MTLLTVEELRRHVTSTLVDEALKVLLDAAESVITARFGEVSDAEDVLDGGGTYAFLRRRAASIHEITERVDATDTVLDTDDYRLRGDGVSVLRLADGTNKRSTWGAPITVSYEPLEDEAEYERIQIALVKLDLNFVPGNATAEQVGAWSRSQAASGSFDYADERSKILDSMLAVTAPGFA